MEEREVTLSLNVEDLLAEQFDYLSIEPEPAIEEGWLQYKRDIVPNMPEGMTEHMLRRYYEDGLQKGFVKSKIWGKHVYYRTLTQEEIHSEDNEAQED